MNKFKKIVSALAVSICFVMGLASCKSQTFYQEWHAAGAQVEEDNCFTLLTADEVKTKVDNGDSFVVFLGSSSVEKAVSVVNQIQAQADAVDYDGKVYFVNTKEALDKVFTLGREVKEKVGCLELDDDKGLVCLCYVKGKKFFDTSDYSKYSDQLQRFILEEGSTTISFSALANYVFENYKVEK